MAYSVPVYKFAPNLPMQKWLVCGAFSLRNGGDFEEEMREAATRDFLTEHGGETGISPTCGLAHHLDGREYLWKFAILEGDYFNLRPLFEVKEHAVAYAWAEIEAADATTLLLGVGSDDGVKVWLNSTVVVLTNNESANPGQAAQQIAEIYFGEAMQDRPSPLA